MGELLVKVYPRGKMGQAMMQLRPKAEAENGTGDCLEMQGPSGNLAYLGAGHFSLGDRKEATTHVVMLAAGSGITPMIQLLKPMMSEWREERRALCVSLVFSNRREEDIIFRQ